MPDQEQKPAQPIVHLLGRVKTVHPNGRAEIELESGAVYSVQAPPGVVQLMQAGTSVVVHVDGTLLGWHVEGDPPMGVDLR
jgi:hypothetical protein